MEQSGIVRRDYCINCTKIYQYAKCVLRFRAWSSIISMSEQFIRKSLVFRESEAVVRRTICEICPFAKAEW